MGTTRPGGYYRNASGVAVDAEGRPIAADAVADAADETETEAPAEAKPAAKSRGKKK